MKTDQPVKETNLQSGKWLNKAQIAIPEFREKPAHQLCHEVFQEDDSSSDEELLGDEVFLQRHLTYEIDEIKRYNIGVQETKNKKPSEASVSAKSEKNAGPAPKLLLKRPREASDISNLRTLADEDEDASLNPEENRSLSGVFNFSGVGKPKPRRLGLSQSA